MVLNFTIGGILRFINTIGASWSFAVGNILSGVLCVVAILVTLYLENLQREE